MQMKVNLKINSTYIFMILLIIYNLILRYPITPHEIGYDSFEIHTIANTVSTFGYAKWWLHPSSVVGLYPYSYASAVPFILSGMSQLLNIDMETTIFVFSVLIGIFSAYPIYILAGLIKNDETFKALAAFTYSTSAGMLYFTTWTVSTRGLFIVLVPLLAYTILKRQSIKYWVLTIAIATLLFATHHLIYYSIIIISSFLLVKVLCKLKLIEESKNTSKIIYYATPACLIILIMLPFFSRTFMETGSRYEWIIAQTMEYVRMVGPLLLLAISGFLYIILKRNKNFGEWFLLTSVIGVSPLLYVGKYTKWFMLFLIFLLVSISLKNTIDMEKGVYKNVKVFMIIILLTSTVFTCYFQFLDSPVVTAGYSRYMTEKTYSGARWIGDYIGPNERIFVGGDISARVCSISKTPTLLGGPTDLIYGFINASNLEVVQNSSITSLYKLNNTSSPSWVIWAISTTEIDKPNSWAQRLTKQYNISYAVENKDRKGTFERSLKMHKLIYDNGEIGVWYLYSPVDSKLSSSQISLPD